MTLSTAVYLTFDRGSWHCTTTPDGRLPVPVGCSHRVHSDARRHRAALAARTNDASPAVGLHADPSAPPHRDGSVSPTAGAPEGTSRRSGTAAQ